MSLLPLYNPKIFLSMQNFRILVYLALRLCYNFKYGKRDRYLQIV